MAKSFQALTLALGLGLLGCGTSAWADCDPALLASMRDAERLVDPMRADKPGQARVFAADGSEYSAGQVRWLAAELHTAERNCRAGNFAAAREHLTAVEDTLTAHAWR
jgi:hypothetical protein